MSFNDREEKILNILNEKSFIRSSELAKLLYVSVSTLRRDLEKLEKRNIIIKEHGICKLSNKFREERGAYELREQQYNSAKLKIAKEAVKLIKDGDNIMMDGSSTVYNMIHLLEDYNDLLVIYNIWSNYTFTYCSSKLSILFIWFCVLYMWLWCCDIC